MALVPLRYIFPTVSRSTLHRWRKLGKIPPPDAVVNGNPFYREDRFGDTAVEPAAKPKQPLRGKAKELAERKQKRLAEQAAQRID